MADRAAFLKLASVEQRTLLNKVTVADGALQATEVRARLVELLAPTDEHRFIESMADSVEGSCGLAWPPRWQSPLTRSVSRSTRRAARCWTKHCPFCASRESGNGLPTLDPQTAPFPRRLQAIAASGVRLDQALDDYRRAFAHRSLGASRAAGTRRVRPPRGRPLRPVAHRNRLDAAQAAG